MIMVENKTYIQNYTKLIKKTITAPNDIISFELLTVNEPIHPPLLPTFTISIGNTLMNTSNFSSPRSTNATQCDEFVSSLIGRQILLIFKVNDKLSYYYFDQSNV